MKKFLSFFTFVFIVFLGKSQTYIQRGDSLFWYQEDLVFTGVPLGLTSDQKDTLALKGYIEIQDTIFEKDTSSFLTKLFFVKKMVGRKIISQVDDDRVEIIPDDQRVFIGSTLNPKILHIIKVLLLVTSFGFLLFILMFKIIKIEKPKDSKKREIVDLIGKTPSQ